MKKTLQLLVALMVTATINAQSFTVDDISYEVLTGTDVQVTGSTLAELVIPSTVDDSGTTYTVTQIAGGIFNGNSTITSVVTPSTLTTFAGTSTFRSTANLVSADLSASNFTGWPNVTFRQSGIQSVILPASLTDIGHNTFRQCASLTSVTVLNPTPAALTQYGFNNGVDDGAAGTDLSKATLTVPVNSVSAYATADYWKEFGVITDGNETVTLNTNSVEKVLGFSLYPNPTNGIVSIKNSQLVQAAITVYDINGRALLSKNLNSTASEINISSLASGLYIFRVKTEKAEFSKRILKQ